MKNEDRPPFIGKWLVPPEDLMDSRLQELYPTDLNTEEKVAGFTLKTISDCVEKLETVSAVVYETPSLPGYRLVKMWVPPKIKYQLWIWGRPRIAISGWEPEWIAVDGCSIDDPNNATEGLRKLIASAKVENFIPEYPVPPAGQSLGTIIPQA